MLTLPNRGNECIEFYSSSSGQLLFTKKRTRSLFEYSSGGRIFIDGKPTDLRSFEELWSSFLKSNSKEIVWKQSLASLVDRLDDEASKQQTVQANSQTMKIHLLGGEGPKIRCSASATTECMMQDRKSSDRRTKKGLLNTSFVVNLPKSIKKFFTMNKSTCKT